MARPDFTPVYEESESTIRDRMLGRIDDTWRKEPGDFMYDAVAAAPLEVKQLQTNQDATLKNAFAQYAEGQYLDDLMSEVGLTRAQATPNKRTLQVTAVAGVSVTAGQIFTNVVLDADGNPLQYTADAQVDFAADGTQNVEITCSTKGTIGNVLTGTEFSMLPPIPGVSTIVDAGTTTPGADTESDDSAFGRYDFKVKNPDTGGNKNDYVRWAQDVTGVGKAKTIPRWNGNGTVKVVIVGTDYKPATQAVVSDAQAYIDPGSTGLGDGKAPCGAQVTAESATGLNIDVAATITYTQGADQAAALAAFEASLDSYLQSLVFVNDVNGNPVPVVWAKVGGLLIGTNGVSNYANLTLNGAAADVPVGAEQVAVRGTVTLT